MRGIAIVLAMTLTGCGFKYKPTDSSSMLEDALLSETKWAAGILNVRVRGEITETISQGQIQSMGIGGVPPTAWYQGGVAWYYRPRIPATVSIDPEPGKETARNIAVHEVCHANHFFHDIGHWDCMNGIAVPTYPRPTPGATLQHSCF